MVAATTSKVTAERIRYLFDYDPLTGELVCKVDEGRRLKVL